VDLHLRYYRYANTPPEEDPPEPSWSERWSNAELLVAGLLKMWPSTKINMRLQQDEDEPIYEWTDYEARRDEPPNSLSALLPAENRQGADPGQTSSAETTGARLGRWLRTRLQ
jgi:hypothetical protein